MLLKKIQIPPIYIDESERYLYKEALIKALTTEEYDTLIRFYYYKICDSIVNLDIERSIIVQNNVKQFKRRDF